MDKEQEAQWMEAQRISIGEDLVSVAQRQLEFLAAVDRRRWLYDSPGLERAIYRYSRYLSPLFDQIINSQNLFHLNYSSLQFSDQIAISYNCCK